VLDAVIEIVPVVRMENIFGLLKRKRYKVTIAQLTST
jgi:hypothetical protein